MTTELETFYSLIEDIDTAPISGSSRPPTRRSSATCRTIHTSTWLTTTAAPDPGSPSLGSRRSRAIGRRSPSCSPRTGRSGFLTRAIRGTEHLTIRASCSSASTSTQQSSWRSTSRGPCCCTRSSRVGSPAPSPSSAKCTASCTRIAPDSPTRAAGCQAEAHDLLRPATCSLVLSATSAPNCRARSI
jgi:hypothetical protein